jgi:photosystem II stability/assembly factor-like uncharacterized protein
MKPGRFAITIRLKAQGLHRRSYGCIARWDLADEPSLIHTQDGGRHWQNVSQETQIPHIRFIARMVFLTPELGWIAGADGTDILVFRTSNGGRDWEESRTTGPRELAQVRDLFFLDQSRGRLITWHFNDRGTYLFSTMDGGRSWTPEPDSSFQGKEKWASVVRFVSPEQGFVFVAEGAHLSSCAPLSKVRAGTGRSSRDLFTIAGFSKAIFCAA